MAHAGEHFRTLRNIAFDALAHGEEGLCGTADFRCSMRLEIRNSASLAKAFRSMRKLFDWANLIAQEKDGDGKQHERRSHHPQYEHIHVRCDQTLAWNQHAQNAVLHLDS